MTRFDYNTARPLKQAAEASLFSNLLGAEVAELADALDSNSSEAHTSCGFDPRLRHSPVTFAEIFPPFEAALNVEKDFFRETRNFTAEATTITVDFVL